jgi:hypothetical protein
VSELELTTFEHLVIAYLRDTKRLYDRKEFIKAERRLQALRSELVDTEKIAKEAGE